MKGLLPLIEQRRMGAPSDSQNHLFKPLVNLSHFYPQFNKKFPVFSSEPVSAIKNRADITIRAKIFILEIIHFYPLG